MAFCSAQLGSEPAAKAGMLAGTGGGSRFHCVSKDGPDSRGMLACMK